MTQAISQTERINEVQQALDGIGFQRRLYRVLSGLVRAIWLTLLAMLAMIIVDAVFTLPGNARLVMATALVIVFLGSIIAAFLPGGRDREQSAADARRVERANRLRNNAIINALFLSRAAEQTDDGITGELARRSVARGRDALNEADRDKIIDRQCLRREAGWLWAALVAWLIVGMIQPRVFSSVLPRIANPLADFAPFSMTEIDVTVNPDEIFEGDDANVTATIDGRVPEQVDMVILDEQGNEIDRIPMNEITDPKRLEQLANPQSSPNHGGENREPSGAQSGNAENQQGKSAGSKSIDGAFERSLQDLTEPLHFRIEAGGARSDNMTIEPKPRSEAEGQDGQGDQQSGQGGDQQSNDGQDSPNGQGQNANGGQDGSQSGGDNGSLRNQFPEFFEKLDQLARNAGDLQQRSQQLKQDMPQNMDSPAGQQWRQDMRKLYNEMQEFRQNAGDLAQTARDLARQMQGNPQMQSLLTRMAMQLEMLAMNGLGQMPQGQQSGQNQPGQQPGQPGQSQPGQGEGQGNQPGLIPGQGEGEGQGEQEGLGLGQGQGEGEGDGGQQASNAAQGSWLEGMNRAAMRDAAQLDRMMRELADALTDKPGDQDADAEQNPWPETAALGKYLERLEQENKNAESPDAVMLRTPAEYRELNGRYFKRVEDDQ